MQLTQAIQYAQQHFPALCEQRPLDSHKGTFGAVGIVGGASTMAGAGFLAARSALKQGAGRVFLGLAQTQTQTQLRWDCDPMQPEIMLHTASALLNRDDITAWAIGCGLGLGPEALNYLTTLVHINNAVRDPHGVEVATGNFKPNASGNHDATFSPIPLLIDADGLTLCARNQSIKNLRIEAVSNFSCNPWVLTPHPGEAARLLHTTTKAIQEDRIGSAQAIAKQYYSWVVLKGIDSVICAPDGDYHINNSGNPGLSTAGSGDVLSGLIISCLAQHIPVKQAVNGAVWLHGMAAEYLAQQGVGPIGLAAGELIEAARYIRNLICYS